MVIAFGAWEESVEADAEKTAARGEIGFERLDASVCGVKGYSGISRHIAASIDERVGGRVGAVFKGRVRDQFARLNASSPAIRTGSRSRCATC